MKQPIARLQIRVAFDSGLVIGPGKADLLEHVRDTGSISAAGRRMKMSYRRAWDLIDAMNRHFATPVVETSRGGTGGGGARLTAMGEEVIARYRRIQAEAEKAVQPEARALHRKLVKP
jgi:molybdate transport system regulatory protein